MLCKATTDRSVCTFLACVDTLHDANLHVLEQGRLHILRANRGLTGTLKCLSSCNLKSVTLYISAGSVPNILKSATLYRAVPVGGQSIWPVKISAATGGVLIALV